jgi:hypothetical protein
VTDNPDSVAAQMLALLDALKQIGETVDGYRQSCIDRGYSPTAAEKMAMDVHSELIRVAFATAGK